jgi:hypothetical protein
MRRILALTVLLMAAAALALGAQKDDYLSDEEEEKVREAQEPSARIEVYLAIAQTRVERVDEFRIKPVDPAYDVGGYIDKQFDQYIRVTDDLKNWIDDQFDRRADMRAGLKKLLETGPTQLEHLRQIQQSSDPYSADYRKTLGDAIDDFNDALDGATKALSEQTKLFGVFKSPEKAAEKAEDKGTQEQVKEDKHQAKEDKKLRKKEHEKGVPSDPDVE